MFFVQKISGFVQKQKSFVQIFSKTCRCFFELPLVFRMFHRQLLQKFAAKVLVLTDSCKFL